MDYTRKRNESIISTKVEEQQLFVLQTLDWKEVVFVPFKPVFRVAVFFSVFFAVVSVIYVSGFEQVDQSFIHIVLETLTELIYVVDTVLHIVHRVLKNVSSSKAYFPKSPPLIAIDIISLLPLGLVYDTLSAHRRDENVHSISSWLRANRLLRVYRLAGFFADYSCNLDVNQVSIVTLSHLVYTALIVHVCAAIWYQLSCWKCPDINWSVNLESTDVDLHSIAHWYVVSYTVVTGIVTHNWRGNIRAETSIERLFLAGIMLSGLLFEFGSLCGRLISVFVKLRRRQVTFEQQLMMIKRVLFVRDVDNEFQNKIFQYYEKFWERRSGVSDAPFLYELPLSLQKEVTLDIFWEACRHSHILPYHDASFMRSISLHMKSQFFLPGEYVFKRGVVKSEMVYIVTGVLQILSEEDSESPLLSFSSGTCLGEISLLFPISSKAEVKSATYCEIQTLSIYELMKTLSEYPHHVRDMLNLVQRRLGKAKGKWNMKRMFATNLQSITTLQTSSLPEIKWMKAQWRKAVAESSSAEDSYKPFSEEETKKLAAQHTSEFLDLLVLSEEVELKTDAVCLRTSWPWILEPNSSFLRVWEFLVLVSVAVCCVLFPYCMTVDREFSQGLETVSTLITAIYIGDLYIQSSTAIKTKEVIITRFAAIFRHKLKRGLFLIDILSAIPIEIAFDLAGASKQSLALCRVNRLFRILKVMQFLKKMERVVGVQSTPIRVIKYVALYLLLVYWFASVFYIMACPQEMCKPESWYAIGYFSEIDDQRSKKYFLQPFLIATFYSFSCLFRQGVSNVYASNIMDITSFFFVTIVAYFLFNYCFSDYCSVQIHKRKRRIGFQELIADLNRLLRACRVDDFTKSRVYSFMFFQWDHNLATSISTTSISDLLGDATEEIREQVLDNTLMNAIRGIPLFEGASHEFVRSVALIGKLYALNENAIVTEPSVRSCSLNVIRKGFCKLVSHAAGDIERGVERVLGPGSHFPVLEFFHQIPALVTVTTITHCELIVIEMEYLTDVLKTYPEVQREIKDTVEEQEAAENIKSYKCSSYVTQDVMESGFSLYPFATNFQDIGDMTSEEKDFMEPWIELGSLRWLRYFMFRKTIKPTSKLLVYWEVGRIIFAVASAVATPAAFSALMKHKEYKYSLYFLDVTAWIDMYARLHVGYFNDKNILVKHPLYTAKHYMTHAFVVDLLASLPQFLMVNVHFLLGTEDTVTSSLLVLSFSRYLQLYRFYLGCSYLESDVLRNNMNIMLFKYILTLLLILHLLANILPVVFCTFNITSEGNFDRVVCRNETVVWKHMSMFSDVRDPVVMYVGAFFYCVSMFTLSTSGTFKATSIFSYARIIGLGAGFFFLRAFLFAVIASMKVISNINLTMYQDRMKNFIKFIRNEAVDNDVVKKSINHFEHEWSRSRGTSRHVVFAKLYPALRETMCFSMYSKALKMIQLFRGAGDSFYRDLSKRFVELHFTKGEIIIKCNDVQGDIYFAYRGHIDVIAANGARVCFLKAGCIFGSLEKRSETRQTMSMVARTNVDVLSISTLTFYKIISQFPIIAERFEGETSLNSEYIESSGVGDSKDDEVGVGTTSSIECEITSSTMVDKMKQGFKNVLSEGSRFYKMWSLLVCVVASYVTVVVVLLHVALEIVHPAMLVTIYLLDLLFFGKIYVELHTSYTDVESGMVVDDVKEIAIRYVKSYDGFVLDLISAIPIDLIAYVFGFGFSIFGKGWGYWLKCNRLLRMIFFIKFFQVSFNKLNVNLFTKWAKVVIYVTLLIHVSVGVHLITSCETYRCEYRKTASSEAEDLLTTRGNWEALVLIYTHIINLFTTTGLRDVTPHSMTQLVTTMIMRLVFQLLLALLIGEISAIMEMSNHTLTNYENKVDILRSYLRDRDLSPALQLKVRKYAMELWSRENGEMFPIFVEQAPPCLKEDLKNTMYGHHLQSNYVFSGGHVDLLRQIVAKLQRCVFFPGDYVTEKGDVDNCMYFIHEGEVEVVDRNKYFFETVTDVLKTNDVFGMVQGLHENKPHFNIYRARTVADILILDSRKWTYLLQYFPASKHEIYRRVESLEFKF